MADTLTVTFGGREVVLEQERAPRPQWRKDKLRVIRFGDMDYDAHYDLVGTIREHGITTQAAVSAVETKLRNLHSELGRVLGVGKESEHGEA